MIIKLNRLAKKEVSVEKTVLDENLTEIIDFLKSNDNRATQKQLREHIGYSEAKVSLMVAELESIGYLKKIKKGRGNLIFLRKI